MKVFVIGRDPVLQQGEIAVKIDDPTNTISRTHCRITQIDDQVWFIKDLGSKNGTVVGGSKINEAVRIKTDEVIRLSDKVTFTASDVSKGAKIKVEQRKGADAEANANDELKQPHEDESKRSFEKNIPQERQNAINNQQKQLSNAKYANKLPPLEEFIPVLSGTSLGAAGAGSIIAALAIALLASISAYFVNNAINSSGGSLLGGISAGLQSERWVNYDDGLFRFKYPANWTITSYDGQIAVASFSADTMIFSVGLVQCANAANDDDFYALVHNAFYCNMIQAFKEDPMSTIAIGMQKDMKMRHRLQTVRGKYNWQYMSFSGPALSFAQLVDKMVENIDRKTDEFSRRTPPPKKIHSKRNYYVCSAGSLVDNRTLVIANAIATDTEDDTISEYFLAILKTLQVKP